MKQKLLNAFVIALILFQAMAPIGALAYTGTDQADYQPGAVVYISGDNSNGAGYAAGESVHVELSGPNGFAATCDVTANGSAVWVCQLTLPADAADGSYTYVAIGQTSGASQNGGFTVTAPPTPTAEPSQEPTQEPTAEPTQTPTVEPAQEPTQPPTESPTSEPTQPPAVEPTASPTVEPTDSPTEIVPALTPFIRSDKEDYAPADLVTLTSGNWQPGEWVVVYVNDNVGQTWSITTNKQADSNGSFTYQFSLPNWFVATYFVTAAGDTSGVTTTEFTDSQPGGINFTTATSVTIAPGGSAIYGLSITKNGNDNACTITMSVTGLPSGASASFSGSNPFDMTNANVSKNLTISTTNAITPGTYPFTVQADKAANCQGGSTPVTNTNGILVVVKRVGTVTVGAQTGTLTYGTPGSATFLITVNRNGATGTGFTVSLGLSGTLPVGTTAVLSSPSLAFSATDTSKTSTLTITTIASTPAGPTSFTVNAVNTALPADNSSGTGTLTINKAGSTTFVTCPAGPFTYTGSALTPCSATVTGAGGLNQSVAVSYSNNTNAGTATATATFAGDANHNGSSDSKDFTIDKAGSVTTVTCPASVPYTGAALTPCTVSVTGTGGLSQALTVAYTNNTNAGTATASASYAGDANHSASSDSRYFTIDKAASTVTVTCPDSQVYTGAAIEPCTAVASGAGLSPVDVSASLNYTNNVVVGTATANASYDGDANHNGSTGSDTFEIAKASSTVTVTCPINVTYTGAALTPCSAVVTGVGGLNQVLAVSYADNTNAGTATASASFAGDANHNGNSDSDSFTIDPAASTTVVTCDPGPFTYTGAAQTPCSVSVTGAGGLNLTPDPDYANNVNAGTATASYTYPGDANHTGSSDSETFTIGKASSTTVVTCDAGPFTYDGTAQEPCSVSVTGAGGLNLTADPDYANNVNAGTATASYSYPGDANHNGSSDSKTFTIDKASSVTLVSCPSNVTYTGAPHEPCTANVTGAGGLDEDLTVSYSNNTDAGTATASASYAGDDNYLASSDSETFSIDKADSVTTVTCPGNVTYTAAAQTPCSAAVTGAGGLDEVLTVSYTDNVNAGTATASASYGGDANHESSSDSETFTIDKAASVTVVTCPASVTYTGSAIEPCSAVVTGAGGLNQTLTVSYSDNTNAGTATASASFAGDANHTGSSDSKTFTIDKAGSTTAVTCPASQVYTGSAVEPCTAIVTGAGGLNQSLTVSYSDNVVVGTATASANFTGDANHLGSSDSETFAITKAASTVTVTCPVSQVYTGSEITPCTAEASGVGMSPVDVSDSLIYTDNSDVGTAMADASWDGDDNHFGSAGSETFEITKAPSTVTVTCPASQVYTGSAITPCTAEATGAGLSPIDVSGSLAYTDNTSVGTATASASWAGDDNHFGSAGTATFAITKAASDTVVTCAAGPFVYDDSAFTPCSATVTGAGGLNQSLTVSYADNTNAGAAIASASFAGDANHNGSSDTETFTIEQASSTTTVTCPANVTYTGAAQTPCSAAVTGAGGLSEVLTVSYSNNVTAGTASASAEFTGDANHTGSSDSKTFTIDKAVSTTTVTCPSSVTFTGAALTPCFAVATGIGGLNQSLTVSYTDNVNAGTTTASASFAGDANHLGSSDSETFTIDKAASVTTFSCAAGPFVYNGAAHTPCTANVTGAGGLDAALTVSYTNNVNAGTATASASFAGDANHNSSSGSKTFTINKADSTTTVTCPASVYFTGSAITPCSAVVTGAGGLNQSLTVTYSNNTAVGTATANASYTGDANHNSSSDSKTFTIVAWTATGFYQPVDMGGVVNTIKGGQTVPLKFELFAGTTELTSTSAVMPLTYVELSCSTLASASLDEIETVATGGTSLRYDATGGQFIYNWKTPSTANKCYRVTMTAADTVTKLIAYFKTK